MSERRDLMWREWEKQWRNYPSQDNEGYQPDRGSYKAGFLDGFKTADTNPPGPSRDDDVEYRARNDANAIGPVVHSGIISMSEDSFRRLTEKAADVERLKIQMRREYYDGKELDEKISEAVAQAVREVEAKHEAEAYAVQLKWQKSAYHDVCGFLKRVFGDRADPFVNSIRMHFLLSPQEPT